jgi:hypothetical protein
VPLYTGTACAAVLLRSCTLSTDAACCGHRFMKGGYRAEGGSSGWTGSFVRPYTRILFFFFGLGMLTQWTYI